LDLNICPDRDEILVNSGNLFYQLHQYVNAAEAYNQITSPQLLPYVNIALSYAHIVEPVLAMKYIQLACLQEPKEILNLFCKDVFEWIYLDCHQGDWNKFLPPFKSDLFY
jgi:hypothetical protein